MSMRFSPVGLSAFVVCLHLTGTATGSDFNGEVLIAPPPPNWNGGSPVETEEGMQRTWRRPGMNRKETLERVFILRMQRAGNTDAQAVAQRWQLAFVKSCASSETRKIEQRDADIGSAAITSAICVAENGRVNHARAMTFAGEFYTYRVVRSWVGDAENPGNPRDSQRLASAWDTFFNRISVCNTLTDTCDSDDASAIHAHPRFKEMRQLETAERPILPAAQVLQGANALGRLTGRAEACGEDVSPLLLRVGRMFDFVTTNDAESTAAQARFEMAREDSKRTSGNLPAEVCGEVRRQFREHPSRVQGFARYILSLI